MNACTDEFFVCVLSIQEFLRPIVTPYELEIALQTEPEWTGEYVLDFKQILDKPREPESSHQSPSGEEEGRERNGDDDEDRPVFSLVTGTYRHAKRYGGGGVCSFVPSNCFGLGWYFINGNVK